MNIEHRSDRRKLAVLLAVAAICALANGMLLGSTSSPTMQVPSFDNDLSRIFVLLLVHWGGWAGAILGICAATVRASFAQSLFSLVALTVGTLISECLQVTCEKSRDWFDGLLLNLTIYLFGAAVGLVAASAVRRLAKRKS